MALPAVIILGPSIKPFAIALRRLMFTPLPPKSRTVVNPAISSFCINGCLERHVGIYVYRREALARFVAAPPSPLEQREQLEQLRALEMGMTIRADAIVDFPKGVDSPGDLEAARALLSVR